MALIRRTTIAGLAALAVMGMVLAKAAFAGRTGELYISPEYVAAQIKTPSSPLLVDVRSSKAFEKLHIPGAIHVPLHFIRAKTHLKHAPIVLVNSGFRRKMLIRAVAGLNETGFMVRILEGGLNAWMEKGLPVAGDPFAKSEISMVSPRDVFAERKEGSFFPLSISGADVQSPFSGTILSCSPERDVVKELKEYLACRPGGVVLVFSLEGEGYGGFRNRIKKAGIAKVFYLRGGLAAYEGYLEDRRRAVLPREKRLRSISDNRCRNCE
jgi:rhodanese-related sulfurtransferase